MLSSSVAWYLFRMQIDNIFPLPTPKLYPQHTEVQVTKHSTQQGLYILDLDPCIHSYISHGGLVANGS